VFHSQHAFDQRGQRLYPEKFSQVLLVAIEEGLSSLGNSPREAIFYHLEASFQLKKEDIPMNLIEFKEALEEMFGPGTVYIERLITRRLCEKFGLNLEDSDTGGLLVCVENVKKQLLPKGGEKR
jgi:hypothetical protein